MNQFANTLAEDWWNFDLPQNAKMISMTKFHGSLAASRWLRIFKEELAGPLSPSTWLEWIDALFEGRATSWAEHTPEVVRILVLDNIVVAIVEDKNTFIRLLIQEFPGDLRDVITVKKASAELSNLTQKEDEDLYIYYRRIEGLLKGIQGRDQVTNSGRDTVALSLAEQQLLKDTIMKFILGITNLDLQFRIVKYRANPTSSLYGMYKQAKSTLLVLQTQAQLQESRE